MTLEYRTPKIAEAVTVIHTVATRGSGTPENPVREVDQYWSKDGYLLAEKDEFLPCSKCGHLTNEEIVKQFKNN